MKIGFLGVGSMGGSILNGYAKSRDFEPNEVLISGVNHEKLEKNAQRYRVKPCLRIEELVKDADVIFIGIKPDKFDEVLPKISKEYTPDKVCVSMAAGISLNYIKEVSEVEKYLEEQSKYILERVNNHDKLYIEFGGKLLGDLHAKRVLPGFDENAKIKVLNKLKDKIEVIICVYAGDIERNKIRGDFGITYDMDVFRLIDDLRENDLKVNSVVITRYEDRPSTALFITRLERRGIKVYKHYATKGYPSDVDTIVSDEGYGKNAYIETTKPIVVVTAPGPGSGKLATCLSQLYHEYKRGKDVGYSKFETFPVWNVPLKHPLNIAYEAATVDLNDVNMIDPFHLEEYGE